MDAVVLVGCSPRLDESVAMLRQRGIPLVAIEGDPADDVPSIGQDNRDATRLAAEHLHDLGHRDVAIVTLPLTRDRARGPLTPAIVDGSSSTTATDRLAGARDVFPEAGGWMTRGSFVEEGRIAGTALLSDPTRRPTAIIAQSDLLAAGVIRAAEELGLEVPADVSVVGFDGVRVDGLWPYDLTTLVQPAVEKGRAAGRAIVEMLEGRPARPTSFTSDFHRGNTTAPPRP
jgi:DNA-binding LacI/PurR family transcriptional regulator